MRALGMGMVSLRGGGKQRRKFGVSKKWPNNMKRINAHRTTVEITKKNRKG